MKLEKENRENEQRVEENMQTINESVILSI